MKKIHIAIFWIISFIVLHRFFTIDYNNGKVDPLTPDCGGKRDVYISPTGGDSSGFLILYFIKIILKSD